MAIDPANQLILERMIRHGVFIERYKTGLVNKIMKMFNSRETGVLADIQRLVLKHSGRGTFTELRIKALASDLKLLSETYKAMADKTHAELTRLAFSEADWHKALLNAVTPVGIDFALPTPKVIEALASKSFVQGALIKDWYADQSVKVRAGVIQEIRNGMIEGQSVPQMIQRIAGTRDRGYTDGILNAPRHHIEAIVRTSVTTVNDNVRLEIYKENDDLIKGEYWCSTLDTKTCLACVNLDKQEFPIGEGPRPSTIHFNCRCSRLPVLKSWKELGINLKESPEGTRASMTGQVPRSMNYRQWFEEKLKVSEQREVLGPNRYRLWNEGRLSIEQFTDDKSRPLTLSQLEKLETKLSGAN